MSPQAQLLLTGAVEVVIGLALAWCAYLVWRRRSTPAPVEQPNNDAAMELVRLKHAELLKEVARLVGEHTQSVEYFQKTIERADAQVPEQPVAPPSLTSHVQLMRAANVRFGKGAESKSDELSAAIGQNPAVFQDVSAKFSNHQRKAEKFDTALESVPSNGTALQIQQMTFESLRGVLEAKHQLELELSAAHKQIEQQAAKLRTAEHDARVDPLTRIPNRRAYDEHMEGVHNLFERQGIAYSLVLLDLDNFKRLNDTYGHAAGDAVLQVTAKLLQSQLRLSDRAFRIGGEEFVLVLVATSMRQATIVAERARKRIEASVVHFEGKELRVTTSAGVAEARPGLASRDILELADAALYAAKSGGRNRIHLAKSDAPGDEVATLNDQSLESHS